MRTFFLLRVILSFLRSLFRYKAFFVVCERLNNFIFIIDMVTVFYLFFFKQLIPQRGAWYILVSFFSYLYYS